MKSNRHFFAVVILLMVSAFTYAQDAGIPDGSYKATQIASTGKPHIITMESTTIAGISHVAYTETIDGVEVCSAKLVYAATESKDHYLYKSSVPGTKDCTNGAEMHITVLDASGTAINVQRGSGRVFSFVKQ